MRKPLTICCVVIIAIVGMAMLKSRRGGAGQFSPQTFEYRTQSERTLFGTGMPFYRSNYHLADNPLINMLIEDGLVAPQRSDNPKWEHVFWWTEGQPSSEGYLYDVLHRNRDRIMDWSRQNPECAKIYWTEGFRLLRSNKRMEVLAGSWFLYHCWRFTEVEELHDAIQQIKAEISRDNNTLHTEPRAARLLETMTFAAAR